MKPNLILKYISCWEKKLSNVKIQGYNPYRKQGQKVRIKGNYEEKLSQEIMRRNYHRKLWGEIITGNYPENH